jgi:uncharacterized membrane protein
MQSRRSDWMIPASLFLLSIVPAIAGMMRLAQLAMGARVTVENARFLAQPLPVVLHILAVVPFSVIGALQFAPAFRRRNRSWHRAAGKVIAICGMVTALTGLWMAHFYPWPAGDGQVLYLLRLGFGSAMAVSIILSLVAVRRRDFTAHGAWMTRGYAIGMGAGTQVLTHLPWFILVGKPGESSRAVLMGAGWVINLIVAEYVIRKQSNRATVVSERPLLPLRARQCHGEPVAHPWRALDDEVSTHASRKLPADGLESGRAQLTLDAASYVTLIETR